MNEGCGERAHTASGVEAEPNKHAERGEVAAKGLSPQNNKGRTDFLSALLTGSSLTPFPPDPGGQMCSPLGLLGPGKSTANLEGSRGW